MYDILRLEMDDLAHVHVPTPAAARGDGGYYVVGSSVLIRDRPHLHLSGMKGLEIIPRV